jgi:hypothetical protein
VINIVVHGTDVFGQGDVTRGRQKVKKKQRIAITQNKKARKERERERHEAMTWDPE